MKGIRNDNRFEGKTFLEKMSRSMMQDEIAFQQAATVQQITSGMVSINAGQIALKDEGSKRRWTVQLQPFNIGQFVVTQAHYNLLVHNLIAPAEDSQKPIVEVSWLEATRFCNLLSRKSGLSECYSLDANDEVTCDWEANGYRLPSEAEWEFACRAGSNEVRYGELNEIAWFHDNSGSQVHQVGTKTPNAWGLYDMIGNVWEWCWDIYDANIYGPYRVFRGGGWSDQPRACRASCRRKSHPTFRVDDLGFRLAQSIR
jgi:formylglycine-generating enzyme required for sulfatase activity